MSATNNWLAWHKKFTCIFSPGVDKDIAKVDYNTNDFFIHFSATNALSTTLHDFIDLVDDTIDEASVEFFVIIVETDDPRLNLTNGRFASRGYIRDNDGNDNITSRNYVYIRILDEWFMWWNNSAC